MLRAWILSNRAGNESLGSGLSCAFFAASRLAEDLGSTQILAYGIKSATLLNKIKELSSRANIEPVWNAKVCGTPVQLGFLELNYLSREEYGLSSRLDNGRSAAILT